MKPVRSEAHLAFIRSLPCLIPQCRSRFTVAAHTSGSRGMGQKRSDLETVPMCEYPHHKEQHRIGWKAFSEKYELDIPALIAALMVKPRIVRWEYPEPTYWMDYRNEVFRLNRAREGGVTRAIRLAQQRRREWLIDNVFKLPDRASLQEP
jgi:hypothetical protein